MMVGLSAALLLAFVATADGAKLVLSGPDSSVQMGQANLRATCASDSAPGILFVAPASGGGGVNMWPWQALVARVHSVVPACSTVTSLSTPCAADEADYPKLWSCHFSGTAGTIAIGPVHAVATAVHTSDGTVSLGVRTTVTCIPPSRTEVARITGLPEGTRFFNLTLGLSHAGSAVAFEGVAGGDSFTYGLPVECRNSLAGGAGGDPPTTQLDQQKDYSIVVCHNPERCEDEKAKDCPLGYHLCTHLEWNHYNDGEWKDSSPPGSSYRAMGAIVCRDKSYSHSAANFAITGRGDMENNCFPGSHRPTGSCADGVDYGCDSSSEKASAAACCVDSPRCGNGAVDTATEECDDGNEIDGDGCDNDCKWSETRTSGNSCS